MDLMVPDSGLLFWMLISFAILFFVLAKFGWPIITGMVDRRKERIDKSLAEAAEARALLATLKSQGDTLLQEARDQQSQMMAQTAELRKQLVEEAREAARAEGARMLEEARKQADLEREAARKEMRAYVATLSVAVAEKILRQQLDTKGKQSDWMDRLLDETTALPNA